MLHPTFRGSFLDTKDRKYLNKTVENFIKENETAANPAVAVHNIAVSEAAIDSDDEEEFYATFSQRPDPEPEMSQSLIPQTPLQAELAKYLKRFDNEHPKSSIDVLQWWSGKTKVYPLLSRAVRKYLAIQATSCASERAFSKGGQTVTTSRMNLSSTNVHMLVYVKSNIQLVKLSGKILEDEQEKLMENEQQHLPLEEAIDDGYDGYE